MTVAGDTTEHVLDLAATLPAVISDTEAVYLYGLDILAQQTARYRHVCVGLGSMVDGFLDRHRSAALVGFMLILANSMGSCLGLRITTGYPPPAFPSEELLLDVSVFPEGWQAYEGTYNPRERLPADQIARGYVRHDCPRSTLADHSIYRFFEGENSAAAGYRQYIPIWFAPEEGWDPWSVPKELPYESPVAEEFRFNCQVQPESGAQTCQAVGRYEEYVVRFYVHMDSEPEYPQCMSFADLEQILIAIDERMALYVGRGEQ
jgi:hypothetical protein